MRSWRDEEGLVVLQDEELTPEQATVCAAARGLLVNAGLLRGDESSAVRAILPELDLLAKAGLGCVVETASKLTEAPLPEPRQREVVLKLADEWVIDELDGFINGGLTRSLEERSWHQLVNQALFSMAEQASGPPRSAAQSPELNQVLDALASRAIEVSPPQRTRDANAQRIVARWRELPLPTTLRALLADTGQPWTGGDGELLVYLALEVDAALATKQVLRSLAGEQALSELSYDALLAAVRSLDNLTVALTAYHALASRAIR